MLALSKILKKKFAYSPYYFSVWRILFGFYSTYYSLAIFPYALTLYSNVGIYDNHSVLPFFPNVLAYYDGIWIISALCFLSLIASVGILVGYKRQFCSFLLWFFSMCLFGRNAITFDPSFSFVMMATLLLAIIPEGEPFSLHRRKNEWYMPYFVYLAMLITIGVGYSISGYDKLLDYGWYAGDAIKHLFLMPIAYDSYFVTLLRNMPPWVFAAQTWFAAYGMLLALPLLLHPRTRFFMWSVLTGFFLIVLFVLDIKQVIFGVLLSHAFLFDNRWVTGKKAQDVTLFYDTGCNLCNGYRNFIETEDAKNITSFNSLKNMATAETGTPDTIVLVVDGTAYYKSEAVVMHLKIIGGIWRVIGTVIGIVPTAISNRIYTIIGKHRYEWFGSCHC